MQDLLFGYPLAAPGGAFVLAAGLFFAVARLDPARDGLWTAVAFTAGGMAATAVLFLTPALSQATAAHWLSLALGLLIEVAGVIWANRRFAGDPRKADLAILAVVGVHFLPMAYACGPLLAVLAIVCTAIPLRAWTRPAASLRAVGLADALLKIMLGGILLIGSLNYLRQAEV